VAGVVTGTHADLLEHLAGRIADAVFATAGPLAEEVWVRVTKLRPPVPLDLASSAVSLVRSRPTP
jgi:dihydroneopterin aldolase